MGAAASVFQVILSICTEETTSYSFKVALRAKASLFS